MTQEEYIKLKCQSGHGSVPEAYKIRLSEQESDEDDRLAEKFNVHTVS